MWNIFNRFSKCFRSIMAPVNGNNTVVVVLGATGTGKSKLALEIASKYDGEIISADSMQIYKGLDIATNKVSAEERLLVPHHMMDFLEPFKFYNVVDFRDATLPIINRIHNDGKLPVIVGGTHYYVESLLWNVLVSSHDKSDVGECNREYNAKEVLNRFNYIKEKVYKSYFQNVNTSDTQNIKSASVISPLSDDKLKCLKSEENGGKLVDDDYIENCSGVSAYINSSDSDNKCFTSEVMDLCNFIQSDIMDKVPNTELLDILETVDSEVASSYHPNNRRKILRSLEVWAQTGVRHSEHIRRQSAEVGGADLGGRIRFENVAILWVTCDQAVLDKRLDERVDAMMEQGLLQELSDFHATHNAPRLQKILEDEKDQLKDGTASSSFPNEYYTRGIFQCIGFKEFHDYFLLTEDQRQSEEGQQLYRAGIEKMKLRTRQYSRRQIKWIRNRFLLRDRMKLPVYTVDGTVVPLWKENVSSIAYDIIINTLLGKSPSVKPVSLTTEKICTTKDKSRHVCEICDRLIIGSDQWEAHLQSAKHRKMMKRKLVTEEE